MSKWLLGILFPLVVFSCKTGSDMNQESKIELLRASFEAKDALEFYNNFPNNFTEFKNIFGWNDDDDIPNPLYDEAFDYINFFFDVVESGKVKNDKIFSIAIDGTWEADGVNYYQMRLKNYVFKYTKKSCSELTKLSPANREKFWFFFFDSPSPDLKARKKIAVLKKDCGLFPEDNSSAIKSTHGTWRIYCDEGSGSLNIRDQKALIEVNSNQIYIDAILKKINDSIQNLYLDSPRDLGSGGMRLNWGSFSKDSIIAELNYNAETNSIILNWHGFYDTTIKKRVWEKESDFQLTAEKERNVKLVRCE